MTPIKPAVSLLCLIILVGSPPLVSSRSQVGDPGQHTTSNRSFVVDYDQGTFVRDGKPFRYVSGSFHYFRTLPSQWNDRLRKARLGGLNAITTYVAWNLHQRSSEAEFDFSGNLDLFRFLSLAQANDLVVILRIGPYMDAERDMGGFPAWLLWQTPAIQKLRSRDPAYIYFVSRWFDALLPRLVPYLYENGGPIIMVQVENEYGSSDACDSQYTGFLRDLIRRHLGNRVTLFTTDGSMDKCLKCGVIPGVFPTVDFGPGTPSDTRAAFTLLRQYLPGGRGPLVNSEFYPGWLDHWQYPHSKTSAATVTDSLRDILRRGASVNIYMFHGGTSFGYGAGANIEDGVYKATPTSYDYDAPLSEAGDPTPKYFQIKQVIGQYLDVPKEDPTPSKKGSFGKVPLRRLNSLLAPEFLAVFGGSMIHSPRPVSFEDLHVGSGFVLYQTKISFQVTDPVALSAPGLRDRAYVYLDKVFQGVLSREGKSTTTMSLQLVTPGQTLSILVENQGRIAFGPVAILAESKGLGLVTLGGKQLDNWIIYPKGEVDSTRLTKFAVGVASGNIKLHESNSSNNGQVGETVVQGGRGGALFAGNFTVPRASEGEAKVFDTFVRVDGFGKGFAIVNGFNLGRYWPDVGPQVTLYLPGDLLKPEPAVNTIVLFELERAPIGCYDEQEDTETRGNKRNSCFLTLTDTHIIDGPTPFGNESSTHGLNRVF